jgi:hypothetical protein
VVPVTAPTAKFRAPDAAGSNRTVSFASLGIGFSVLAAVALAVQSLVAKVGTSQRPVSYVLL